MPPTSGPLALESRAASPESLTNDAHASATSPDQALSLDVSQSPAPSTGMGIYMASARLTPVGRASTSVLFGCSVELTESGAGQARAPGPTDEKSTAVTRHPCRASHSASPTCRLGLPRLGLGPPEAVVSITMSGRASREPVSGSSKRVPMPADCSSRSRRLPDLQRVGTWAHRSQPSDRPLTKTDAGTAAAAAARSAPGRAGFQVEKETAATRPVAPRWARAACMSRSDGPPGAG